MNGKQEGYEPRVDVNENGGKQHAVPYAFHLLPPKAILAAACVMKEGAKYDTPGEERNYYKIPVIEHINHALGHLFLYLAQDESEAHISHSACRILMAIECLYREEQKEGDQQ